MFAVVSTTAPLPPSPTLVATALPDTSAARVPYDNVVPSVSNAKVDNNASGNRNPLPKADAQPLSVPVAAVEAPVVAAAAGDSTQAGGAAAARTAFLAQLAAQDDSSPAHVIFVQYEKLVSYATVKYKPSDAAKPSAPTSLFSRILHEEHAPAPVAAAQEAPVQEEAPIPSPASAPQEPVAQISPAATLAAYAATVRRNFDFPAESTLASA